MKTFLMLGFLVFSLSFAPVAYSANAPINCFIQTYNGRYLTAVGGGGRINDVMHSDATQAKAWEKFTLVDADEGTPIVTYGIRTVKGFYLGAVNGGGMIQDAIHSDATRLRDWEKFQLISLGGGYYAIKTYNGRYLTAVGGGGRITDVLHTDATRVGNWEKFKLRCGV